MPRSSYSPTGSGTFTSLAQISGTGIAYTQVGNFLVEVKKGISPQLFFKSVKRKMGLLEGKKFNDRIKRIEKAFINAVDNGQCALGEKLLEELARETRESALFARGIKFFIEKTDLDKNKMKIRDGHISDTRLEKYTRVIPDDVLRAKKKVDDVFDGFVIYHYWNEKEDDVRAGKQKMNDTEKAAMRDPILFGYINESNRLYFVADWEDEFCDLTFDEIIDVIGKDEDEYILTKNPKL